METNFFKFKSYREFLQDRFDYLKTTKPHFSARHLAKISGVNSPSYFQMVVSNQRKLSLEYAERYAEGLQLSKVEKKCLLASVNLENVKDQKQRLNLLNELKKMEKCSAKSPEMPESHVEILSDLVNLKLYLLAQSKKFICEINWINEKFAFAFRPEEIGKRIELLLNSGLWARDKNGKITTIAPTIKTGHELEGLSLLKTHENILDAAKRSLRKKSEKERLAGGRTFLFDKKDLARLKDRVEQFKQEIEGEFENLDSTDVYQLHVSFYEIDEGRGND